MEVDDFISQFYNLTGIQYGERRRNFFFLLNQHSFLKDSKNELDQIVQNLKPRNHSERILRIDFLIFFRRYNELHQDYLRGDDMTIKKLSKQRWFHEKAFQVDDIIEFINNFLPSLPYTVRVKYLKKLQCDEEKCNKIFDAITEKYGIFVATNMLHKCSCEKIAEILRQYPIKLSHRDIKRIFDKKSELVDIYFEQRKQFEANEYFLNNDPILIYIAQKDPDFFCKLKQKYDFQSKLGRRTSKKLITQKKDLVLTNPKSYSEILQGHSLVRKLGGDFKQFFHEIFPKSTQTTELSDFYYLKYTKYYPKKYRFLLYKTTFDSIFYPKFGENLDLITFDKLELIYDVNEREKYAQAMLKKSENEKLYRYFSPKTCLDTLIPKFKLASRVRRLRYMKVMTECALLNRDQIALKRLSVLLITRCKNEDLDMHSEFLNEIFNRRRFVDTFTEDLWKVLAEVIINFRVRNDYIGYSDYRYFIKYLEFLFNNNQPLTEELKKYKYDEHGALLFFDFEKNFQNPKFRKAFLIELLNIPSPPRLNYINKTTDPCQNFYEFSCGKWSKINPKPLYEPVWNPLIKASNEINRKLQNLLQIKTKDEVFQKAQLFYKTCLKSHKFGDKQTAKLRKLIDDFHGWPLVSQNPNSLTQQNWFLQVLQMTRRLGISPIIKTHVDINYQNTTQYILYVQPGDLVFPLQILQNPSHYQPELKGYHKWIQNTIRHLYPETKNLYNSTKKIVEFEIQLARIRGKVKIDMVPLKRLAEEFPQISWKETFQYLLKDKMIRANDTLVINMKYIRNLMNLIKLYTEDQLQNYIIWSMVRDLSRETSEGLRHLNHLIDKQVLNVQEDLPIKYECASKTAQYFDYALIYPFIQRYLHLKLLRNIESLSSEIKKEALILISRSNWLSKKGRILMEEKMKAMKFYIGYPKWITQQNLKIYYKDLKISSDHFFNTLQVKHWKAKKTIDRLKTLVDSEEWPGSIFDVNAYYSVLQNAVLLPIGLLTDPFYNPGRAAVLNYGALASLIAHELAHSLDSFGRQADKRGNIKKWLPVQDLLSFQKYSQCFHSDEELADRVGLQISYKAFQKQSKQNLSGGKIGGYSREQLFFISFAQMWCEIGDKIEIFEDHDLAAIRVNKAMVGSKDFAHTFQCQFSEKNTCELF